MASPQLLLSLLEDLSEDDFRTFKWHLINHSAPVPRARLENASRTTTVDKMLGVYGGARPALSTAADILSKMKLMDLAQKVKKMCEGEAATGEQLQSTDGSVLAQRTISLCAGGKGSIISPIVTGGSIGTITINLK